MSTRVLLPWTEIQDAVATRLDQVVTGTALVSKVFNYIPQAEQYPFLFFGEVDSEDYSDKGNANLINVFRFEVFSGEAGSRQCQALTKTVLSGLTAQPLVLGGTDHRCMGPAFLRDAATCTQEFDGVGVVWVGRFRVAFLTQQVTQ